MEEIMKLKVLDEGGRTLMASPAERDVSLVYSAPYRPGDRIALEIGNPNLFCVVQFDDAMPPTLVYVTKREVNFAIPFGEQAIVYSPKCFSGSRHVIRARIASRDEINVRRNLAFNPYDQHADSGIHPHASANVETRGEAVFAARNAIDGIFENTAHGEYPYQSWGINRDPNAEFTLHFGRPVVVDELRITLRADYPHDNYWTRATVAFSDGDSMVVSLNDSRRPQTISVPPRTVEWLTLKELIPADGPSPYPALTQLEAWGTELGVER